MKTGERSLEPTTEAMTDKGARKVLVLLQLFEVLTHLVRCPATVASDLLNVLPIIVEGVHADHGVVGRATAQSTSARVENTQWVSLSWRVEANVQLAIILAIHHL